jgi:AcrR family transcriptional regulator
MAITKEHIVEYATEQFSQFGVRSIRMDDISHGLGISKRTLYEIFEKKEALIVECLELYSKRKTEMLDKYQKYDNILLEVLDFASNADRFQDKEWIFINDMNKFYPDLFKKFVETHTDIMTNRIRTQIVRGQQLGYVLEDVDIDIMVLMIRDSFRAIKQYADKNINIDADGIHKSIRNLMLYILRGIATDKGRELINDYKKQYIDK